MINLELYNAITDYAEKYGRLKFNDAKNVSVYQDLVDLCVDAGKICEANSEEYSTHGRLLAAISYESDRYAFCEVRT